MNRPNGSGASCVQSESGLLAQAHRAPTSEVALLLHRGSAWHGVRVTVSDVSPGFRNRSCCSYAPRAEPSIPHVPDVIPLPHKTAHFSPREKGGGG
jgi:hypothetical protein